MIATTLVISVILSVLCHELGHWWGMSLTGLKPVRMTLSFGKPLLTVRIAGVPCSICPIPFGAGIEPPPSYKQIVKWWKKIIVDLAGPLVNLILGFGGFFFILIAKGIPFTKAISATVYLIVEMFSFIPKLLLVFIPAQFFGYNVHEYINSTGSIIAQGVDSWSSLAVLFIAINIMLGMVNLIPFPSLDGYHALANVVEGITRRSLPDRIDNIGFSLLILGTFVAIMAYIGYSPIYTWSSFAFWSIFFYLRRRRRKTKW